MTAQREDRVLAAHSASVVGDRNQRASRRARISTLTERAPASSEFSTSSLTAEAGRSTTSPAAIWLATCSGRMWTMCSDHDRSAGPVRALCFRTGYSSNRRGLRLVEAFVVRGSRCITCAMKKITVMLLRRGDHVAAAAARVYAATIKIGVGVLGPISPQAEADIDEAGRQAAQRQGGADSAAGRR